MKFKIFSTSLFGSKSTTDGDKTCMDTDTNKVASTNSSVYFNEDEPIEYWAGPRKRVMKIKITSSPISTQVDSNRATTNSKAANPFKRGR